MTLHANTDFLRHTWMPEFIPPWKQRNPELPARGVRPDYEAGTWAYATGYPAASHKQYGTAVDLFRKATPNVTPWWIRSVADVEAVLHGCSFDPTRGMRVLRFLRRLIMSDGEWVGKHFTPLDWQIYDLIMPVYSWIAKDGLRRFTKVGLWIPKKNGKALSLDTPIPTPIGWTTMGDIQVGDQVFGSDGAICSVLGTSDVMHNHDCYRVRFSDGTSVVCDAEHEWCVSSRRNEKRNYTATTRELLRDMQIESPGSEGWNHSIGIASPLNTPSLDLPIDPYFLGVWLGDGTRGRAVITIGDQDHIILEQLMSRGVILQAHHKTESKCGTYGISLPHQSINQVFSSIKLYDAKHIPCDYLRASEQQRRDLLCGLMDTDGTISKRGQCSFYTMLERLKDNVCELLRTLGYKPMVHEKKAMLNGVCHGICYCVHFFAFEGERITTLPRHIARLKKRPNRKLRSQSKQIVGIEPCESVPVKCIRVDSKDHLYLCGDGFIPTHNTGGAAGLGLYHLRGEKTGSPYVFIAATDRHQCGLMYKEARNMVENTPDLCEECHPVGGDIAGIKKILYRERNGEFEALSQDDKAKEGLRATAGFLDELHVLKKETFSSLSGSGGAATEPLLWTLSTAGQYDPKSIGWEQWSYGLKIQSGTIVNDSFYALMYRATPHEDNPAWWLDFNEAKRANPSIGSILKTRYIKERIETARTNANELNDVLRYNFNVWVHQRNALISMQEWGACASALSAEAFRESLLGRECFGGLDLSLSDDLTAFALWFPPRKVDEPHKILVDFFLPRMHVDDRDTDGGAYMDWADAGYMHLTEGPTVDYSYVRQIIEDRYKEFSIQEMGFDKYNATETSQKLMELYGEEWCVEVPQSMMHMGPATRYVKELIQNRKIEHPDHPILNYHVSNAQGLYNPTGLYMITKSDKRTRLKVDGFVAVIIAGSRALTRPTPQQSAYTSRGVLSLADIRAQIESEKANC